MDHFQEFQLRNDTTCSWVKQRVENRTGLTNACFEQIGARKKERKRLGWRVLGREENTHCSGHTRFEAPVRYTREDAK